MPRGNIEGIVSSNDIREKKEKSLKKIEEDKRIEESRKELDKLHKNVVNNGEKNELVESDEKGKEKIELSKDFKELLQKFDALPNDANKIQEFVNENKKIFEYGKIGYKTVRGIEGEITLNNILMNSIFADKGLVVNIDKTNSNNDRVMLKNGNPILKVIQLFLLAKNNSILDGNGKTLKQSIDGWVKNDTRRAMELYRTKQDKMNQNIAGILGEVVYDVDKGKTANLEISYDNFPILSLKSYGNTINIDYNKNICTLTAKNGQILPFPNGFILGKNKDGSLTESLQNRESTKYVLKTLNVINKFRYTIPSILKRDTESPAHIGGERLVKSRDLLKKYIEINTSHSMFNDERLITIDTMQKYLQPFNMRIEQFVNFLNIVYDNDIKIPTSKIVKKGGNVPSGA